MSRYIDTKWLEDNAKEYSLGYYDYDEYAVPLSALDSAPSIDIVRCRECKYWKSTVQMPNGTEVKCLYGRKADDFCSYGERSEKPNNCEHITEDGVTCAKYPACDDCLDNPLNKVKGSERLVKGLEKTDCQTCKWWSSYEYCVHRECKGYEPQTERSE